MTLINQTYIALFWSLIDRVGEQAMRFIFSIVMARLLMPSDFGILGMAYVVTEVARIFVMGGFGMALINKQDAKKVDECSVFYFNIFIGALSVVIIYFLAPFISLFFKNPSLIPILRVLSLSLFIGSTGTIQTILMTKNINFKSQTKVGLPSTLLSGSIGIYLALNGFGVWALVYQALLRTAFYSILMWVVHTWRPKLLFSFQSIRSMFRFGSKVMLSYLLQVVFNNIYVVFIGKFFSPNQLGYFTRAQQTQQLPLDSMWAIIGRVVFPVLSTIKNDTDRLRHAVAKGSMNIAFIVFPSMTLGAILAPALFHVVFGEKWAPSVPMFQILCLSTIFLPLEELRNNAIIAKGKSGLQFTLRCIKYASIFLSILATYRFGIMVLLIGFGVISYLNFFLNTAFISRETGYRISSQIADLLPPLFCTLLAGGTVIAVTRFAQLGNSVPSLIVQASVGAFIYLSASYAFRVSALLDNIALINTTINKLKK